MDPQSMQCIKKRKARDEDELMFFIFPALYVHLSTVEKNIRHPSFLYGKRRVREILGGHIKNCLVAFRMEPHIFMWLANYLRDEGLLSYYRLKVEERLAFFLYMISHNASYEDLQLEFKHSGWSFNKYIKQFFDIIPILTRQFLRPRHINEPHPKIAMDNRFFPYFQNCLGAIDGSHVPITMSSCRQAPWRNRKGTLSQNVMIACDFDLNIIAISCGWEGSTTGARVLTSVMLKGFKVPEGKFYLVDGGYANTQSFLAPYRRTRYHLKAFGHGHRRPQNYKELFNHRHAVIRNHVERDWRILKKRFPILRVRTFHPIRNQIKIAAAAAAIFHNIIRMHGGDGAWLDEGWLDHIIDPADYVNLPNDDDNHEVNNEQENHIQGNNLRDQIAWQMWNDYQLE